MSLPILYSDHREAAKEVASYLKEPRFHSVQYNRFDKSGEWWVIPKSRISPAYPHAKFFFSSKSIGFYIEKGIDYSFEVAKSIIINKDELMDENWTWHTFVSEVNNSRINIPSEMEVEICCTNFANKREKKPPQRGTVAQLTKALNRLSDDEDYKAYWVDIYITIPCIYDQTNGKDQVFIYNEILKPFEHLVINREK